MRRALALLLAVTLGIASAFSSSPLVSLGLFVLALALGGLTWSPSPSRPAVAGMKLKASTRGVEVLGAVSLAFAVGALWKLQPFAFPIPWMVAAGCAGIMFAVRFFGADLELGLGAIHIKRLCSIPYEDIASAEPRFIGRQNMVAVMLKHDGRVLDSMPEKQRATFQRQREWRRRNGEADVWIPASLFDVDVKSLAAFLAPKR